MRIVAIRASRTPPGLQPQHLVAIKAVAELSGAEVKGAELGSGEIEFTPHQLRSGDFRFDIGTAGSTTLVLQALMPSMAYAPGKVVVEVVGGTNNPFAPPIEFLQYILLPSLRRLGYEASVEIFKRGFYPKGGGIIRAYSNPVKKLRPITLIDRGEVTKIRGYSFTSRLPSAVGKRMASGAKTVLRKKGYRDISIENESRKYWEARCAKNEGSGIFIYAETATGDLIAADALGKKGTPDQSTGWDVAQALLRQLETNAAVDRHLADQLIVWAAMADGTSTIRTTRLTSHTMTCLEVSKMILGTRYQIDGKVNDPATITIEGKSVENKALP